MRGQTDPAKLPDVAQELLEVLVSTNKHEILLLSRKVLASSKS
jgi:hypothetical protein